MLVGLGICEPSTDINSFHWRGVVPQYTNWILFGFWRPGFKNVAPPFWENMFVSLVPNTLSKSKIVNHHDTRLIIWQTH